MSWDAGPFLSLDIETTGTDPWEDRIVTVSLVEAAAGAQLGVQSWLLNPGGADSGGSRIIHGISTAQASRKGVAPAQALEEIYGGSRVALAGDFQPSGGF